MISNEMSHYNVNKIYIVHMKHHIHTVYIKKFPCDKYIRIFPWTSVSETCKYTFEKIMSFSHTDINFENVEWGPVEVSKHSKIHVSCTWYKDTSSNEIILLILGWINLTRNKSIYK